MTLKMAPKNQDNSGKKRLGQPCLIKWQRGKGPELFPEKDFRGVNAEDRCQ
jgi:hypothetical protein